MKIVLLLAVVCLAVNGLGAVDMKNALGMPEANELDLVQNDLKEILLDAFSTLMSKLTDIKGKISTTFQETLLRLLDAFKGEKEKLSTHFKAMLEKIKSKIHLKPLTDLLKKLLGSGNSTNSFIDEGKFAEEVIEELVEQAISSKDIQRLRAYVERLAQTSRSEVVHALRHVLNKLDDGEVKKVIQTILSDLPKNENALSNNSIFEKFHVITDILEKLGSGFVGKFKDLVAFVVEQWKPFYALLKEKVGIFKAMGELLLEHGKTISKTMAEEALSFLGRYKDALGPIWGKLKAKLLGIEEATTEMPQF